MIGTLPSFSLGFAVGFGSGYMARHVTIGGEGFMRPAIKFVVKSSMMAAEKTRERMAHFSETFEDLVAEARSEVDHAEHERAHPKNRPTEEAGAEAAETVDVEAHPRPVHRRHAKHPQGKVRRAG